MGKNSRARPDIFGLHGGLLFDFLEELESLVDDAPKIQRLLHEEIADEMKRAVDSSISTALDDSHGHVRSWQERHVGSMGGYAAIRPAKGYVRRGRSKYRVAQITTYLEKGHKNPRPPGPRSEDAEDAYEYRPRIKKPYISGRHFYANTYLKFERGAIARAERVADNIAKRLNGGG